MWICNKLDLSICGLFIIIILFFLLGIIFLVFGFKCVGNNNSVFDKMIFFDLCVMIDK